MFCGYFENTKRNIYSIFDLHFEHIFIETDFSPRMHENWKCFLDDFFFFTNKILYSLSSISFFQFSIENIFLRDEERDLNIR